MNRQEIYFNIFSAKALFIAGLLIMPALLFNPAANLRLVQFLFFWFLAWLAGKKTNFVFTVLITLFIVIFNLVIPYGRVLYSIGMFRITSGALEAGLHRAVTFQALIMLSRITIRQDLKLPGKFGKMLCESLQMFSFLMSRKYRLKGKGIISKIDNLMFELNREDAAQNSSRKINTKPLGYIILIIVIFLSWLPRVWHLIC
jgi:heptaprenyl diphosphate synthase